MESNVDFEASVRAFHDKFGHYTPPNEPTTDIPLEVISLRVRLIEEEWKDEMLPAMLNGDLTEIADGGADLLYVVVGCMIAYGLPVNRLFAEVHNSNMTKTAIKGGPGEKYGTKTPKGPDYIPPDIRGILLRPERETLLEERARLLLESPTQVDISQTEDVRS